MPRALSWRLPALSLLGLCAGLCMLSRTDYVDALSISTASCGANTFNTDTLAAPTGPSATGGTSIVLNWTATTSTYASGYHVLRGTASGGPYSQIAQVTPRSTVTYTDTPAAGTYYYVVRAYYQNWESANSSQASATVTSCPSTRPSGIEFIDGFESGRLIGSNALSPFFTGANTTQLSADTAVARYGTYSLKIAANAAATNVESFLPVQNTSGTVRFAVRLASLPTADVELMRITATSSAQPLQLMYHTSTQKFALQFGSNPSAEASNALSAATWYLIEVKSDMSTTTWSA